MNKLLYALAACAMISQASGGPSFSLILAAPGDGVSVGSLTADGALAVGGAQLAPQTFTWTLEQGRRDVPYPPGLAYFGYRGVSADASTFEGFEFLPTRAFVKRDDVRTYIPPGPGHNQSIATSVSADGCVVAVRHAGAPRQQVSFWSAATGHTFVSAISPRDD